MLTNITSLEKKLVEKNTFLNKMMIENKKQKKVSIKINCVLFIFFFQ